MRMADGRCRCSRPYCNNIYCHDNAEATTTTTTTGITSPPRSYYNYCDILGIISIMPRPQCSHLGGCEARSDDPGGLLQLCTPHYQTLMVQLGAAEYWCCNNPVHGLEEGEEHPKNHEDRRECRVCRRRRTTFGDPVNRRMQPLPQPQPQPLHDGNDVGNDVVPNDGVFNEPLDDDDNDDDDVGNNFAPDFDAVNDPPPPLDDDDVGDHDVVPNDHGGGVDGGGFHHPPPHHGNDNYGMLQTRILELEAIIQDQLATNTTLVATNTTLVATNTTLVATNGELVATNRELVATNGKLVARFLGPPRHYNHYDAINNANAQNNDDDEKDGEEDEEEDDEESTGDEEEDDEESTGTSALPSTLRKPFKYSAVVVDQLLQHPQYQQRQVVGETGRYRGAHSVPKRPSGKDAMPNNKYKAMIQAAESASGVAAGTSGYRMTHVAPSGKDAMMPNYSPNATLQAAKAVLENGSLEDRTQSKRLKYSAVAGVADGTSGYRMDHSLPSGLDAMANYSHTGSEDEEADLMKRPCLDRRPNWSKDEDNWTKRPCLDRLWV